MKPIEAAVVAVEKARIAAVVGDRDITFSLTEALFMAEEIDRLRARIAALEATEVRTEWGLLYPEITEDDQLQYPEPIGADDVDVARDESYARREATYTSDIRVVHREVRTAVGPWLVVES